MFKARAEIAVKESSLTLENAVLHVEKFRAIPNLFSPFVLRVWMSTPVSAFIKCVLSDLAQLTIDKAILLTYSTTLLIVVERGGGR